MAALSASRPRRRALYLNPIAMARHFWHHRELIMQFTRREIEGRYRGSFLGILWSLAYPLFMLAIYTFVFGVVLKARWPQARTDSLGEFALIVFCGMTAFSLFGDSVSKAPTIITSVPNYVKKVVFPLEILIISDFGTAIFHLSISLIVLVLAQLALGFGIQWTIVLLPIILLPAVFCGLGLMWFLASLGVFIRDVGQLIGILVQALFFFTPIFYSIDAIPEPFQTLILYNPLAPVVENFRRVMLWGTLPSIGGTALWIVVTGILMMLGYAWFMRTKKAFADVI
jgi:lipopolysaccharide transport system permease protein